MSQPSVLLIRGVVGMIAGLLAFLWPGLTIAVLVLLFGAYAFLDGVANIVIGLRRDPGHGRAWATFAQGLIGVAAGVLTFVFPPAAALALVFVIAAWALVTGVFEIAAAIRLRHAIRGEWLLAVSGILSVVFGAFLTVFPAMGIVAIAWILGAYAAASGVILAALAIRMRTLTGRPLPA
jgi:uncharacterized membrane protein HdeD (DUF308 family)